MKTSLFGVQIKRLGLQVFQRYDFYGPPFQDSCWMEFKIGTDPLCGEVNDFRNVDDDVPIISYRKSTFAYFYQGSLRFPLLKPQQRKQ